MTGRAGSYLALSIGVVGAVPSHTVAQSTSVASLVVTRNWGHGAADVVTVLILITAFASVLTGLLGGSRVPYQAARDGVFIRAFGRLHRPYRQWLYPLPSLAGWIYVYASAGRVPIELSVAWVAAGVLAYLVWARVTRVWPFGPKEFRAVSTAAQP
jgi:hypothetical protein